MHIPAVSHIRPTVQSLDGGMIPFNALVRVFFSVLKNKSVFILENICPVMAPIKHKMLL